MFYFTEKIQGNYNENKNKHFFLVYIVGKDIYETDKEMHITTP